MYHSKIVTTSQEGIHHRLAELVDRHAKSVYRKPYQTHNLQAFDRFLDACLLRGNPPMILDSGCGTGMSSLILSARFPDHLIVGIDQSLHRLAKARSVTGTPDNLLLLQGNCEDLWRLFQGNRIVFERHYLLYPNPWPKPVHIQRRWHGHPVFPVLPDLAPMTEVRSNWKLYLDEFAFAWHRLTGIASTPEMIRDTEDFTLFERKYRRSGQALYQLNVTSPGSFSETVEGSRV